MEEAVVGAVIGACLQFALQNLISVSIEDLEKLKSTFIMIQNILYLAEMQQVTDWGVKQWLKKLEDLAFEAYYVLDEFNYQLLHKESNNMDTQSRTKKKVMSIFSRYNFLRLKLGHKIRNINKQFELINREASSFGLQKRLAAPCAAGSHAPANIVTNSFTVDPFFIGRDNDVSRVVEMLTTSQNKQVFSILPIVGMGGMGKTTLTRKVFNDENIKTHFGRHIWVHVSKNFDPLILLKKILTTLTSENVAESMEVLLKKLQEALGAKTYLLVLDDVWNQDRLKWDDFLNSLRGVNSMKGNGIIVTTRNTEVASIVQTLPIYELEGLPEDNCWSIIKAKAFGEGEVPSEFEIIGRNIAERCQGLPLAANVVGGVLCSKSKDDWRSIQENWLSDIEGDENNISKILKLSFDHLPSPSLKKCFAYCSIFPKGYHIHREKLIELWMAEGFLQADQRNDMEAVGNKIFNLLLQNSLLQFVGRDYNGNIRECNMHDLVHDLACSVLGSSKVLYIGPQRYGDQSSPIPTEEAKCLRTLFFEGEISDNIFSDFKCLHALTLKGDHITELPSSIRKLIHLRYLNISRTKIRYWPDWIGELSHLQTLRADTTFLEKLPSTLKYLISLRHLHITSYIELPPEIGRLTSLQTLPYFAVGDEKGRGIAELGRLKNLKGELEIRKLEKVHDKKEAESAYLSQKPNIVKLSLVWRYSRECERNDENVLEGLQPHPNLKSIEIEGFKGTRLPLWTVRDEVEGRWVGLNNLMEIKLSNCRECEEIPMLGHLPHLKSLYLCGLINVRTIGSSFYGIDNCSSNNEVCKETINVFPVLKRLELSNMPSLTEWVEVEFPSAAETQPREVKAFPCLKRLEISDCERLISLPCEMLQSSAQSLEMLSLKSLRSVTNLPMVIDFLQEMPRLTKLEIVNVPKFITCSPIEIGSFRSLQELTIGPTSNSSDCVSFIKILDGILQRSQSVCRLDLTGMEHWDSVPDQLQHLKALSQLVLNNFGIKTLPEWFGNLPYLKELTLFQCRKLTHLPSKEALQYLTKLHILDCLPFQIGDSERHKISDILNFDEHPKVTQHMPDLEVSPDNELRLTISDLVESSRNFIEGAGPM